MLSLMWLLPAFVMHLYSAIINAMVAGAHKEYLECLWHSLLGIIALFMIVLALCGAYMVGFVPIIVVITAIWYVSGILVFQEANTTLATIGVKAPTSLVVPALLGLGAKIKGMSFKRKPVMQVIPNQVTPAAATV